MQKPNALAKSGNRIFSSSPLHQLLSMREYANVDNLSVKQVERGKFLKKLWCCVGGEYSKDNLVLSTGLIM